MKDSTSNKICFFLTVYEWSQGSLALKTSIKLFENVLQDGERVQIVHQLHYDEEEDIVMIITSNMYGNESNKRTTIIEFKLIDHLESGNKSTQKAEIKKFN